MWTKEAVARTIDHAILKPFLTDKDVIEACRLGKKHRIACVIVRPTDVPLARRELQGSGVKLGVVVGFPYGYNRPEVKALEARYAIQDGAEEIDMMMNLSKFLEGDYDHVRKDVNAVVAEAKKSEVVVKVILEVCYLTADQIMKACEIIRDAGADFVKTSTGFGTGNATAEAVDIMLRAAGFSVKVKAAGGIRNWDDAVKFLNQGCERLGLGSATETVLEGSARD